MKASAFGSLGEMKTLLAEGADVNSRNAFGATAILWCVHDLEKVRLLLANGTDVNARSVQGRTALLIAASQSGTAEVVKLLFEKGADIAIKDALDVTPLLAASAANDLDNIRIFLAKGADVKAKDVYGQTALLHAAGNGNADAVKLLLSKGADPNAATVPVIQRVSNGPTEFGSLTPLLVATLSGSPETVRTLLDAGAQVNARDVRGMTPLMTAIASDHADPSIVRMLLDHGADPALKSNARETALDWARKFGFGPILAMLGDSNKNKAAAEPQRRAARQDFSLKTALEKSIALIQQTSAGFFKEVGCVACHAHNVTAMAVAAAHAKGIQIDESPAEEQLKTVTAQWTALEQRLLQNIDGPGTLDSALYSLLDLSFRNTKPDGATDAMVHYLAAKQREAGNWHAPGFARPPIQDGDFSRTAMGIRALATFGPVGRKAEFDRRIDRAAAWLAGATPRTTEDRVMQLLGLKWAGRSTDGQRQMIEALLALQHVDGGWAQTPELASDAYATGQVLFALHELGISSGAAYGRAMQYLLETRLPDGSWHVRSRAPKLQPYFQSGFPYDHDQWISASGTAWAAMALSFSMNWSNSLGELYSTRRTRTGSNFAARRAGM
jgi:ankyrin repeat protein